MPRRLLLIALPLVAVVGGFSVVLADFVPSDTWPWNRDEAEVSVATGEVIPLNWEDLVPDDFVQPVDPFADITPERLAKLYDGSPESEAELDAIEEALSYAPVDEDLDGKLVTLPGYVVPLDFDGATRLEEFLLVPYYGACIHTPPPPANQIVMATLERAVELDDPYLPVVLRGVIRTETTTSDLAETGYRMDVIEVEPYPVD